MKTTNLEETKKIAEKILDKIEKIKRKERATLITLSGNLGSGKTTLTQQIGKILKTTEQVNSPTFVISKTYPIKNKQVRWKKIIHIDAYRLEKEKDLELIGLIKELQNSDNLIILEWPEKIEKWLQEPDLKVNLKYIDDNTREINF